MFQFFKVVGFFLLKTLFFVGEKYDYVCPSSLLLDPWLGKSSLFFSFLFFSFLSSSHVGVFVCGVLGSLQIGLVDQTLDALLDHGHGRRETGFRLAQNLQQKKE